MILQKRINITGFRLLFFSICWTVCIATITAQSSPVAAPPPAKEVLPGLPATTARLLWDSCTLIDYVFFDLPISMSMDQQNSIRTVLRHIGGKAPEALNPACKPIGKIYYQVKGNIILNASLYLSDSCAYFVFYEGEQKKYANLLTEEGYKFYKQTIDRVKSKE